MCGSPGTVLLSALPCEQGLPALRLRGQQLQPFLPVRFLGKGSISHMQLVALAPVVLCHWPLPHGSKDRGHRLLAECKPFATASPSPRSPESAAPQEHLAGKMSRERWGEP